MASEAIVFNIQHFTIHDGPGIRTELFLKGCPLRCRWCSNPEGIDPRIEAGIYEKKCLTLKSCGLCQQACPQDALVFRRGRISEIDTARCLRCLACAEACPAEAVKPWGQRISVGDAMQEIRRDKGYYDRSGGGVTVSGGEPLLQAAFVRDLFQACRAETIHTCCESCLHVDWRQIEQVLPYTDLFIADIKHMNPRMHQLWTGADNEKILGNLRKLSQTEIPLILRIPVIPRVNDTKENMAQTADFILQELGGRVRTLQLLSYMRLGEEKYRSLGVDYPMQGLRFQRPALQRRIEAYANYFNERGIHCLVGTREKKEKKA